MDITLNESWISGKYSCGVIDTSLGTVEVFDQEEGFFAQDEHGFFAALNIVVLDMPELRCGSENQQEPAFS